MAKFESPLGSKKFEGQNIKEMDVPDESGYNPPSQRHQDNGFQMDESSMRDFQSRMEPPVQSAREQTELEQQMRQARQARSSGKERLTEGARRRIEMLVGMTRLTRSVEIDGNVYALRTLKSIELRQAIVACAEFDGTVQFSFEIAKQLLARSIFQVAGVEIEQFLNSNELGSKLIFVEELDQALVTRLYSEYILLNEESKTKYSIKTPEEIKEVAEDLKK